MNKSLPLLFIAAMSLGVFAQSKDSADEPSVISYKIKTGDTFSKLAQKYLQQPVDMAAIQKANQVKNIDMLPVGAWAWRAGREGRAHLAGRSLGASGAGHARGAGRAHRAEGAARARRSAASAAPAPMNAPITYLSVNALTTITSVAAR